MRCSCKLWWSQNPEYDVHCEIDSHARKAFESNGWTWGVSVGA